jgi:hypothetical protein
MRHSAPRLGSAWDSAIKPLLLKRFPASTGDDLKQAHAYAYGGSIIQDLGYYLFGSKFYSDLMHYVRSGGAGRVIALRGRQQRPPHGHERLGAAALPGAAVGTILPALTKVAWQIKGQAIQKEAPGITRKKFLYNLSR